MMNKKTGERMWSQVTFTRPAPQASENIITSVPTAAEAAALFSKETD
jgi:hypothetical protein